MTSRASMVTALFAGLLPALAAFVACGGGSSSKAPSDGGRTDAAPIDAAADTSAIADTSPSFDTGAPFEAGGGPDGSAPDAAPIACGPPGGCPPSEACCVTSAGGTCAGGAGCGCTTGLQCGYASQCMTGEVCCIGQAMTGCTSSVYQSVCLQSCTGFGGHQLCNPAVTNECLVGRCGTNGTSLEAVGLPADAGYGLCQ